MACPMAMVRDPSRAMKNALPPAAALLCALALAHPSIAADLAQQDQSELIALRDAKRGLDVFRKNGWTFDYDAARTRAKAEDKVLFAYFTRSFAECSRCESLESRVFDQEDFGAFAREIVPFCHLTSHVDGDPHPDLLQQKGGTGWPYLVFLDADGQVLTRLTERSVASFRKSLAKCEAFLAVDKRHRAGERGLETEVLIARIEMGGMTLTEAQEAAAKAGPLAAAPTARLANALLTLEVVEAFATVRTREDAAEVGKRFQKMWSEGRAPTGDAAPLFYSLILEAAAKAADAGTYEKALRIYEKVAPQGRGRERVLERMRQRLEELKKG